MQYIDCKTYAQEILDNVKAVPNKKELIILTMGNDPASESYVKGKIKDCEYCGIPYSHIKCGTEQVLERHIYAANASDKVGGIIVQLPLPEGIDEDKYTNLIYWDKDVDGFREHSDFNPCTPEGIMYVLKKELGDLTGKSALVIGRGKLVGKPIANMLLAADCTVTVAHSKTTNLDKLLSEYHDIVITAVGKRETVDLTICNASVVIDVGVNRDENGKLCGDCYNHDIATGCRVTPVPGGIGLMTRAILMKHMVEGEYNELH